MLALFALAAGNDLSELRVDAGGTDSGRDAAASTTPTTAIDDGGARVSPSGPGSTLPGSAGAGVDGDPASGGTGTGGPGVGGQAPGGGIVTASTEANAGAGVLGSSTTVSGAATGIPVDTGLDTTATTGSGPLDSSPDGSQPAAGQTGDTTPAAAAGTSLGPGGSAAPGVSTTAGSSAGEGAPGPGGAISTTTGAVTTAVTTGGGNGRAGGVAATIRLVVIMISFGASAAGVVWLAASLVRAILSGRRQRRPDDDDDDGDLEALVVIDHASAGWTLEQLRRRLEAEPDPRLAIREAYSVVESGFGIGGGLARRRTETALQYLERTLGMIEGGTRPLRVLTGLFLLARFSNRPMNEAMRRAAIDAVVELQARFRAAEELAA